MRLLSILFKGSRSLLLRIIVFFVPFNMIAKEFQQLTVDDGLSSGFVYSIAKDSLGYLWFATSNGLNRFSGNTFTDYEISKNSTDGIEWINEVTSIRNQIYAGTRDGKLVKYDYYSNQIFCLDQLEGREVLSIAELNNSKLLIGYNKGLSVFDLIKQERRILTDDLEMVRTILNYGENSYLAATKNGVVNFSFGENGEINVDENWLPNVEVLCVEKDSEGRCWLGTEKDGLYVLNLQGEVLYKKVFYNNANIPAAIREIELKHGTTIFLGIDDIGIMELSLKFDEVSNFKHDPDEVATLSINSVRDIFFDEDERMWVATTGGGVNLYDPNLKSFQIIRRKLNSKNTLVGNMIRSFLEDENGMLWIGAENGLSKWYRKKDLWEQYNTTNGLNNNAVLCLAENDEYIIAGTYGGGLNYISKKSGAIYYKNRNNGQLKGTEYIFSVLVSKNGDVWYGGHNGELGVIEPDGHEVNFRIEDVRCIRQLLNGDIVIGSLTGIYFIAQNEGQYVIRKHLDLKKKNFISNYVFSIAEDLKRNCLWIGTEGGGMLKYSLFDETLLSIGKSEGLEANIVYGIVLDSTNDLWLTTNNGIVKYSPDKMTSHSYQKKDGLPASACNFGAYYICRDGWVLVGTTDGAVGFYPKDITIFKQSPKLFIKDIFINGVSYEKTISTKNVIFVDEIELKHSQNSLTFQFEAINYTNLGKNSFQWFFEGYDNEWSNPTENSTAIYNNLQPGRYNLYYIAANSDGVWMDAPKHLKIVVTPPFWRSPIAYLGYAVVMFLLFGAILFVYSLKNREKISQSIIRQFINLAHDIRTPLTLIKLSADSLMDKKGEVPEEAIYNLQLISQNTQRLNRFVTQLLDFRKETTTKPHLKLKELNIKAFISEIVNAFEPFIKQKQIRINLQVDDQLVVNIDPYKMEKVFNNLLSNSIKYSNIGGLIDIKGNLEQNRCVIRFIDDGIGIPLADQKNIFKRFYRANNTENVKEIGSGVGLMLSKKIVEEQKGEISFKSEENKGAEFIIKLRMHQSITDDEYIGAEKINKEIIIQKGKVMEQQYQNSLILIAEDNEDLKNLLKISLSKSYRVIAFDNGQEAYLKAMEQFPDLIISDIMMPGLNGYELCYKIKNDVTTSHIPFVIISALNKTDNKLEGLETGADAYLDKPIEMSLLEATILNLLRSRKKLLESIPQKDFHSKHVSGASVSDNEFVNKVIQKIKDHIKEEDLSVESLCSIMNVSRSGLFRRIKDIMNLSPSELILKVKLNQAADLLITTNLNIGEIAIDCGFSNSKYFSTVFKKIYGKTPREYQIDQKSGN